MSSLSDLFVSYKAISEPEITVPKYNFEVPLQNFVVPTSIQEKVDNVKTRMESPTFKWSSSNTEKTQYTSSSQESTSNDVLQQQSQTQSQNFSGKISDAMFENLLGVEGAHTANGKLIAKSERKNFGENFVTGPHGMVYKHIDAQGNLLKTPQSFKEGEAVSPQWARANARAYYDKQAQEWEKLLQGKQGVTQNRIDALVAATGGTAKAKKATQNFVLSHWGDWQAIEQHLRTHATTAAGNGKRMPGLVIRRQFEADWFKGEAKPYSWYQKNRKAFNA